MLGIKNNVQIEEGITNGINEANLTRSAPPIHRSQWGEFSKDLVWVRVDKNTSVDLPFLANLNAGKIKHVKIQCNEIDPLFFGGKHEKVLTFCNLESGTMTGDSVFYEIQHPLEVDLNSQYIDSLHFSIIAENSNNDILFSTEKLPVFMTLIITKYD